VIGWYVHHHGRGHAERALAVARHLEERVVGLSTVTMPEGWPGGWIGLAPDDDPPGGADPEAGGALHWAPLAHPGLRGRLGQLAEWIVAEEPRVLVVDVSVEVAVFARLLGVPTAVMAMPGRRDDAAHQLAYRTCSLILAPWPGWARPATGLGRWRGKTVHVGAISKHCGRSPIRSTPARARRPVALLLGGGGGTAIEPGQVEEARKATPEWDWEVLGPPGRWEPDPWTALSDADVVVSHAGQGAVADTAAARRPAVIIPQDRPHDEQRAGARVLGEAGLAVVRDSWPAAREWPGVLSAAVSVGGARWDAWEAQDGARRSARVLESTCA
jgi:hypothetical protein